MNNPWKRRLALPLSILRRTRLRNVLLSLLVGPLFFLALGGGMRLHNVRAQLLNRHRFEICQLSMSAPHGFPPVARGENTTQNNGSISGEDPRQDVAGHRDSLPLLTLFTTWEEWADKQLVRNLTLHNWSKLRPHVTPILFTNSTRLQTEAQALGWLTRPITRTAEGVPILKYMYLDVMSRFQSTLYAYSNGDILFDASLVSTLMAVVNATQLPSEDRDAALLVVGRRTNVDFVTAEESTNLIALAEARGELFHSMGGKDYFITTRNYPWQMIPEFVIGRILYDSWLTACSVVNDKITTVDATSTLLAVHQSTAAGIEEGMTHANPLYNHRVLPDRHLRLYQRLVNPVRTVTCAAWHTRREPGSGQIGVWRRTVDQLWHC